MNSKSKRQTLRRKNVTILDPSYNPSAHGLFDEEWPRVYPELIEKVNNLQRLISEYQHKASTSGRTNELNIDIDTLIKKILFEITTVSIKIINLAQSMHEHLNLSVESANRLEKLILSGQKTELSIENEEMKRQEIALSKQFKELVSGFKIMRKRLSVTHPSIISDRNTRPVQDDLSKCSTLMTAIDKRSSIAAIEGAITDDVEISLIEVDDDEKSVMESIKDKLSKSSKARRLLVFVALLGLTIGFIVAISK